MFRGDQEGRRLSPDPVCDGPSTPPRAHLRGGRVYRAVGHRQSAPNERRQVLGDEAPPEGTGGDRISPGGPMKTNLLLATHDRALSEQVRREVADLCTV